MRSPSESGWARSPEDGRRVQLREFRQGASTSTPTCLCACRFSTLQADTWQLNALIALGDDDDAQLSETFVESGVSGPDFAMETVYAYLDGRQIDCYDCDRKYLDAVLAIGTPEGQMIAKRVALGKGTNGSDLSTTSEQNGLDWIAALGFKEFVLGGDVYGDLFPHNIGLPLISLAKLHSAQSCYAYLVSLNIPNQALPETDSYLTRSAVKRKVALCGWASTDICAAGPELCGLRDMVPWTQVMIVGHLPLRTILRLLVSCKVKLG